MLIHVLTRVKFKGLYVRFFKIILSAYFYFLRITTNNIALLTKRMREGFDAVIPPVTFKTLKLNSYCLNSSKHLTFDISDDYRFTKCQEQEYGHKHHDSS